MPRAKKNTEEAAIAVEAPKSKKRVKPGSGVKAKNSKLARARVKKAEEPVAKKTTKKATKKKVTKKASSTSNDSKVNENIKATLDYFIANPGSTRTAARAETGNQNLGLPYLIQNDHVKQESEEGVRGFVFSVTASGKRLAKKM